MTALVCDGVSGFFVPSNLFRRPGGMAEAYRLHGILLEQRDLAMSQVRDLSTATASLERARLLANKRADLFSSDLGLCRADLRECNAASMSMPNSSGLWASVGAVASAAICIGISHSLRR